MLDPTDAKTTLLYYSGGDGPHSGGGKEHGRANWMARATAPTDGLAGLAQTDPGGVGTLHTHPITVHSSRLRMRIAGGAEASVGVRVESEAGELLLEGVGMPAVAQATAGGSEEIEVQWSSPEVSAQPERRTERKRFARRLLLRDGLRGRVQAEAALERLGGGRVVLALELRGAALFSFGFAV